ncbi:MAG: cell division protein ZapA [Gemmatimonadetes bacterium]|nr:cell division protein ZapA [Gemmatimonadota bacterium]
MTASKHSTRVTICGEEYTIRTDASPDHTRAVAAHVDKAIREVMGNASVVESHKAAILAALSITDDLFRERSGRESLAGSMDSLSSELRRWLPPGKRGESS